MVVADNLEGLHRLGGYALHLRDFAADLLGCFGRLIGEIFNFGGADCETLACMTRTRRLDRGAVYQELGLYRDVRDQAHAAATSKTV